MFFNKIRKKNNVYPCKHQFYYLKWGLRGPKLYRRVFEMPLHGVVFDVVLGNGITPNFVAYMSGSEF